MAEAAPIENAQIPELEEANFEAELCRDAARLLRRAMDNKDAYVINGVLVLKISRAEEAFHLGMTNIEISDARSYGMRVGLCVQDAPPFRRGQWYTLRGEQMIKRIVEETEDGTRSVAVPVVPTDWKIVTAIAEANKSEDLLEAATAYAQAQS